MRRYRNARYAPESLERKLSPSAALAPAPAVVASPDVADSQANGLGAQATSVDYSPDAFSSADDATSGAANVDDPMLTTSDDDVPPPPDDSPPVDPLPTVPTGPAVPAYS